MPFEYPTRGANDVSSYFASGIPWVTGSTLAAATVVHYSFPAVTKKFIVRNTGTGTIAVGFTQNALLIATSQKKFFTLTSGQEETLELRVKDLFLSASSGTPTYEIIAGLTPILYDQFPVLTGSVSGTTNLNNLFSGIG